LSDRTPTAADLGLHADCSRCFGLCCVALPFAASADFAVDKDAGTPCTHLQEDFSCGIHAQLRRRGFAGCAVFDCFGAGQKVSQVTFGGRDWRSGARGPMFAAFAVVRQLHELLWYLVDALSRPEAAAVHPDLRRAVRQVEALTRGEAAELAGLDVAAVRREVDTLLVRTSALVRAEAGGRVNHRGADLVGGVEARCAVAGREPAWGVAHRRGSARGGPAVG
jgi:hypothetical protein